ncbi:MAG TPA: LuxR C-terminal-related transcriptional regulator [Haliangium sp.]|nr:LuxR C-terminal-related transcriptional regulator [Haliangium sp.]
MSNRGHRDRRSVERARRLLKAVSVGGSPAELFEALRACAPVAGGLIGTMGAGMTGSMISHVVGLPGDVLEEWAATPLAHLRLMMEPLIPAKPGDLISDRMAITGSFREKLSLLRVLGSAGLGESAGYKVAVRTSPSGKQEHSFLTVALEGREVFTPAQREIFRRLHPMIEAALARMALPLVAREPFHMQVLEEDRIGYLCLSNTGAVIELNERAHVLARQYSRVAHVEGGRGWLARFAEQVLMQTRGRRAWSLRHDNGARVEIRVYRVSKEYYPVGQDLVLVELHEVALACDGLTPRECEIAHFLVLTGLSQKQIADKLGISEGTLRKHAQSIFDCFGVHSRPELIELLSQLR